MHYGIREFAMGAGMNGMAQHGGVLPVGGTFFVFSDYMRPAVRLAALSGSHVVYSWTHDSIGVGEDGPTHQPVEHLAALRAMPGLVVVRPADANETAAAWRLAVDAQGPIALVLTRQNVPVLDGTGELAADGVARGAYVLADGGPSPDIVLVGSGSEVQHCVAAAAVPGRIGGGGPGGLVPVLGVVRRARPTTGLRRLPPDVPVLSIEAGSTFGWERYADDSIGIDHFGASAPAGVLMEEFGFTADHVVERARSPLAGPRRPARRETVGDPTPTALRDRRSEPLARQPAPRLAPRRTAGRAGRPGRAWRDVEPDHLRQCHQGQRRVRRAIPGP